MRTQQEPWSSCEKVHCHAMSEVIDANKFSCDSWYNGLETRLKSS